MTERVAVIVDARLSRRALALLALVSLLLAVIVSQRLLAGVGSSPAVRTAGSQGAGMQSFSPAARASISAALGAADPAYRVIATATGMQAANPAQHLRIGFDRSQVALSTGHLKLGLSLRAAGYGSSAQAVGPAAPTAHVNRVTYAHAGIGEWYVNGPLGLEQGFTLARMPVQEAAGPLTLAIGVSGGVHAVLGAGGRGAILRAAGQRAGGLRYGGLSASDARGHALHSWMTVGHNELLLHIDTRGARFPVTVDPVIEEDPELSIITPPDASRGGRFGLSVALSADGNTALIGAPKESEAGAAWVFTHAAGAWNQTGTELTMPAEASKVGECGKESSEEEDEDGGSGEEGEVADACRFGMSVALSSDGDIALVGAPHANDNSGAVWIFTRSGSTWTQAQELSSPSPEGESRFGRSVAISADGSTVLVGAPMWRGRAWVFTRSGSSWTLAGEPLSGGGEEGEGAFGTSVALSADGQTALIGAPGYGSHGAAWVFDDSGSSWSGSRLAGAGESSEARFGSSVALSGDASTALVGARLDNGGTGAAWVFANSGTGWSEQGPPLTGEGEAEEGFGDSVALSFDGDSALIGAQHNDDGHGMALLYERSGTSWGAAHVRLQAGSSTHSAHLLFGSSVALSATAETRLVGGRADAKAGAAWVFGLYPSVESVTPDKGPSSGGTPVTITGEHFTEATAVRFGGEAASFSVTSGKSISAVSPPGSGTVDVTVETGLGTSAKTPLDQFTYTTKGEGGGGSKGGGGGGEPNPGGTSPGGNGETQNTGGTGSPKGDSTNVQGSLVTLAFGPVASKVCGASLLSKTISVQSHGHAMLKLVGTGSGKCSGKLTLRVKLAKKHAKTKTIGTGVFSITAGKTVTILVKLNATGRHLLSAGHGKLNASLLIVKSSPAPTLARTASVRLAQHKARKSKSKKG